MKVGVLGTGFGAYHANIYRQQPNVEGVKIFGRNEAKLERLAEKLQVTTTNDLYEILRDPEIELVDVCLPSPLHRQYVIEALQHGKHVFCETPVSFTLEDAKAIRDAEKQYGKRVFVNQFMKFCSEYTYLQDLMQNNTYGKLKALHLERKTAPLWGDLGLRKIVFLMLHELDFVTWVLGRPESIAASGIAGKVGESHITTNLSYAETLVTVTVSSMMPDNYPFTISYEAVFKHGSITFTEQCFEEGSLKSMVEYNGTECKQLVLDGTDATIKTMEHVLACLETNADSIVKIDDAIGSLELALQIRDLLYQG